MITKKGINASPGVAIGTALVLDAEDYRIPRRTVDPGQIQTQITILDNALETSRNEVGELRVAAARKIGEQAGDIFRFHEGLIGDRRLRDSVAELITHQRNTAAYAFSQIMGQRTKEFRALNDPYLKERVRDLHDIERRVLRHILGRQREAIANLSEPVIVFAHDLTPSQAVSIDRKHVLGFALDVGGQTSHTAILVRMMDIPSVIALNDATSDVTGGETVIVDGVHGIVVINPNEATLDRYRGQQREYRDFVVRLNRLRDLPSVTRDDARIELFANIELADESEAALEAGAEGVGLYRTEFLFLSRTHAPSEDEQYESYRRAGEALKGRPLVIRTMDLGADKLSFSMGMQHDPNPDLGLRSLRYCLQHLDLFKTHLRAILRASVHGNVRIMFPMITTPMELRQARATLADVMEDLDEDGIAFRRDIQVGIMVETPAAAIMAASLARDVDFMSIGTNDLTEYTLAVDRGNERVAHLYAPHSPAVLRLIRSVLRCGSRMGVPVNLCGEMAGSPVYCQLLIGLGLRRLSMTAKDIPEIKRIVRSSTISECRMVARESLRFDSDRQVLNFLRDELRKLNDDPL